MACDRRSQVNTLGGAGAAYLATAEARYLEILRNAYDFLQTHEVFATDGYGPDEQLLPHKELVARLETTPNTFETQCGSWGAFKLCKYYSDYNPHGGVKQLHNTPWTCCTGTRPQAVAD